MKKKKIAVDGVTFGIWESERGLTGAKLPAPFAGKVRKIARHKEVITLFGNQYMIFVHRNRDNVPTMIELIKQKNI